MSQRAFVHLHCHSHFSLLDGAGPIEKLVERCKGHGMNALALTDHGNLHGALQFYREAKAAGVNPIIGCEAYIAPGSRFEKSAGNMKEASYHLTLLAKDRTGFKNLVKLASAAYLEGFYFKPRIDKELLERYHEGIICLSGCVSSEFSRAILRGVGAEDQLKDAIETAQWFHRLFGDRYFIEVMNNGVEIQRLAMEGAVEVSKRLGIPLVATSDTHYVDREDADAQDILLCINTGKFRTDTTRMRMDGNQYYLRSPEEMYEKFPGHEDAVARSQEIADSVHIELELGKRHFPTYPLPQETTAEDYLRKLCIDGLKERYADEPERWENGELSKQVMDRLNRELSCISKLGFPNYFLIVWDFVREARRLGIPATARGSGVGAIVCYALYLSHVCPIKYDLLFERFLDENRREAPDIDIDFCKERRGEIIRYVKEKYGEANVAQIGTFGTLAARAAIKDVGRALGIPLARVNQVTEMVPEELGITLDDALEKSEDLKKTYETDAEIRELLDFARKIEGLARNVGTHAAAVVIADQPLTEYVPLGRVTGKEDIITQWSMGDVEAAGLLKMDFLGLRNLTILRRAVDFIKQTTGKDLDLHKLPLDDKKTFELLQRGETKGVFQLESGGIRDLLQKMKPDSFHDIIATNALYRPGPLEGGMVDDYVAIKHGRKQAEYKHPVLKEVLSETYNVMVYQEQIMRILNRLGNIPLAAAYTCIKAISKKKESLIQQNYEQFIKGATDNGLSKADAQEIWELIVKFAGYGFNKCVVGETVIVNAATGERTTVGELFAHRRPFSIHALGEDGRLRPRQVTDVMWNGRKRVYRVSTAGGRSIIATANHPIYTPEGWTWLADLRIGSLVAAARHRFERLTAPQRGARGDDEAAGRFHALPVGERLNAPSENSAVALTERSDPVSDADFFWDTIISIEPQGVQDTYDLTVEHDHNFVADGLIVHNSHSTAYALVAYQTAYLKAHYPVEFMAALLSGDIPGRNFKRKDLMVEHLDDCARMGVEVIPPSVNASSADFTVKDGKIHFALAAVKGCGGSASDAVEAARSKGGPFADIFDFCERVDPQACGRGTIETLVKAGAMDCFGAKRRQLMAVIDKAMQAGAKALADRRAGQKNLFGGLDEEEEKASARSAAELPDLPEFEERERLLMEKEVLGFYLSSHPLAEYEKALDAFCTHKTPQLGGVPARAEVVLGGMVSAIKPAHVRKVRPGQTHTKYANFDLEDKDGAVRCIIWPEEFAKYGHLLQPDAVLIVRGSVDRRGGGDECNIICNELISLEEMESRCTRGVKIRIDEKRHGVESLSKLREIIRFYPGDGEVQLILALENGTMVHLAVGKYRIKVTDELRSRVDNLLGPGNLQLITAPPPAASGNGHRNGGRRGAPN